jgi:ferrous iron transport protein A
MTLRDLAVGESGRVTGLGAERTPYRRRLLSMGLTPGTEFTITRVAPLGDPVQLSVRGFSLSLRKDEAAIVQVERSG